MLSRVSGMAARRLIVAAILGVSLLVAVPVFATGAGREVERELSFDLDVEGFSAGVFVSNNDGDVDAILIISRGPRVAYYSAPAKVTADRVTARFGSLGELDYRFTPKRNGKVECSGSEEGEVVFEGTFSFTGENGYVHIEADKAEGSLQVYPEPKNCAPQRLARRVVPYQPSYSNSGATLRARAVAPAKGRAREISAYDEGRPGPHAVFVFAFMTERREGVTAARGVQLTAGAGAFRWDRKSGTATLRPPAPFTGAAKFSRRGHDGHGTWNGSLSMPIFGGETVKLTGGAFRASIHKGVPQDE